MVKSSTEKVAVELGIDARVRVEIDQTGRQVLILDDGRAEVRCPVPPARDGDEYPYLHVRGLGLRIEQEAEEVKRNTLAWHGPVNGPGGWV